MITPQQKTDLITAALQALQNPLGKGSTVLYVAAVLTKQGNIYSAMSYFSDTLTLTAHGEQAALIHAAAHGENEIVAIASASTEPKEPGHYVAPCHLCKQLLYESQRRSKIPMLVILTNQHGETKEVQLNDMISFAWPE